MTSRNPSARRAKQARQERARAGRRATVAEREIRELDVFPFLLQDGTVREVAMARMLAQWNEDLAQDDEPLGNHSEVRDALLMDLEDGSLRRLPDGRWSAPRSTGIVARLLEPEEEQ